MRVRPVSKCQDQKLLDFTADVEGESEEDCCQPSKGFFIGFGTFCRFTFFGLLVQSCEPYWLISCLVWTASDTSIKLLVLELPAFFDGLSGRQVWRKGTGLV